MLSIAGEDGSIGGNSQVPAVVAEIHPSMNSLGKPDRSRGFAITRKEEWGYAYTHDAAVRCFWPVNGEISHDAATCLPLLASKMVPP